MSKLSDINQIIEQMLPTNAQQLITAAVLRQTLQKILCSHEVNSVDHVKANITSVFNVEEFDDDIDYEPGDIVSHTGTIYKFTSEHTGEWDDNDVDETSLDKEISTGCVYVTKITPTSQPLKSSLKLLYLATNPGTYTNFGSITIQNGEIAFIVQNGSSFTKNTLTTLSQSTGSSETQAMSQKATTQALNKHPFTSTTKTSIITQLTAAVKAGEREYDE